MKIEEVLSKNKYYRLEVGREGKVLGGLFRYANTLMDQIDKMDPNYEDAYGDDVMDSIDKLDFALKVPDVNWNGEDKEVVRCAFTEETFNKHKDTIDTLQTALEHFGYQLLKKEVQPDEDAIIYEDKDQIVYWDDMANIKPISESFLKPHRVQETLEESNDYGYHAGDLGKSEYYSQQSGSRGTGHFGTGTYFVGDPNRIKGYNDYQYGKGEAPHHIVDFSSYNLFKPSSNSKGYKLHDTLKLLDGAYTYYLPIMNELRTIISFNERHPRRLDSLTNEEVEKLIPAINKCEQQLGDGDTLDMEEIKTYLVPENFDNYVDELIALDVEFEDEYDKLLEVEDKLKDVLKSYDDWKLENTLNQLSNLDLKLYTALEGKRSKEEINNALEQVRRAKEEYKKTNAKHVDSLATVFMKALGYDGIDTRHLSKDAEGLSGLDNVGYGSVIYDVKPETIVESVNGDKDTFRYSQEMKDAMNYWLGLGYEFKLVNLEDVIKANHLDNPEHGAFGRRTYLWGEDRDQYKYDATKDNPHSPIRVYNNLRIGDGNHRLYALYNMGYKYAEVLMPKLDESYANNLDKDVLEIISSKNIPSNINKCSKSSAANLLRTYATDKYDSIDLVVGWLMPKDSNDDYEPKNITHMWVEVDGEVKATGEDPRYFKRVEEDRLHIDKNKDLYTQVEQFLEKPSLKEALQQDEYVKDKSDREFKIWTENTGGYGDQSDFIKIAYVGDNWLDDNDRPIRDNLLGIVEYSTDENDKCYVQMIQVKDSEKRKGIATQLVNSLKKDYGDNIEWGYTTDEGTQLLKSLGIREDLKEEYTPNILRLIDKLKDYNIEATISKELYNDYKLTLKSLDSGAVREVKVSKTVKSTKEYCKYLKDYLGSIKEDLQESPLQETDSEVNPLTKEQVEFFRNSKVRDSRGRLLVCYHGSKSSFSTFDKSKIKPWGWYGKGFYFTPSKNVASNYSEGHMIICYLNITNPFYADDSFTNKEEYYNRCDKLYELVGITKEEIDKQDDECRYTSDPYYKLLMYLTHINSSRDINDYVKELGYDGVIGLDAEGEEQELIIFDSNQIKSIDNKNPSNSDNVNEDFEEDSNMKIESLTEGKQDKENFRKWITSKVDAMFAGANQSNKEAYINNWVDWFEKNRSSLKPPKNDYYYWIKQDDFDAFTKEVYDHKVAKDKEAQAKQGARLIYDKDGWKVYNITNYPASAKYGKGTKWCISGSKRWGNDESGEKMWNDYSSKGIKFYFFIHGNTKYALALYPDNKTFELFDERDNVIAYIPDAPMVDEIGVDYTTKDDLRIFQNLIARGDLPNWQHIFEAASNEIYVYEKDDFLYAYDVIPEGYMEWEACNCGQITPERYQELTGDEYDDWWSGDYPMFQDDVWSFLDGTEITYQEAMNSLKKNLKKYVMLDFDADKMDSTDDYSEVVLFFVFGCDGSTYEQRYHSFVASCVEATRDLIRQGDINASDYEKLGISSEFLENPSDGITFEESLKESKTFTFPNLQQAIDSYWSDRNVTVEKLPIEKLVQDNDLLNDEDLQSYHQRQWDNKSASEFSINQDKIDNMRMSEVPYAVKHKDGRLELGDGRHRVRALYNDGYKYVVMPLVIDENITEALDDSDTVEFLYHGSPATTLNLERDSTLWLAEDYEYALEFGDNIFICSAHLPNILEVGNTDGYIRGLIPTQFSKEFTEIANKLNMQPKELLKCNQEAKNIYSIIRTNEFRKLCMVKGYDAVETIEFGNVCYGVFDRHNVELVDVDLEENAKQVPMDEAFTYTDRTNVNNLTELDRQYFDYIYSGQSKKAKEILNKLALDWGALSEGGVPLELYHGTHSRFTKFDAKQGFNVDAIYFSNSTSVASHWSAKNEYGAGVGIRGFDIDEINDLVASANRDPNKLFDILNNHLYYDIHLEVTNHDDEYGDEYRLATKYGSGPLGYKKTDEIYFLPELPQYGVKYKEYNLVDILLKDIEDLSYKAFYINNTLACYIKMKNPLVVDAKGSTYYEIEFEGKKTNTETISSIAKKRGYDGVIVKDVYETDYANIKCNDYIVFEPNQIKSCNLIVTDDDGDIIPPSKRFTASDDIREDFVK